MPNTLENSNNENTFDPLLDSRISAEENLDALATLKIGKAPGPDQILGKYLKIFGSIFETIMLQLIRKMFAYTQMGGLLTFLNLYIRKGK